MELSYWEYKSWLTNIDFTIIGSGIVGLSCAIQLKKRFPEAKVLVLEKGMLPQGASTKNAGFACFGSISEVLSDLKNHSEEEVVSLVDQRYKGIQRLRTMLGDHKIGYLNLGGHELFLEKDQELFDFSERTFLKRRENTSSIFSHLSKRSSFFPVSQVCPTMLL